MPETRQLARVVTDRLREVYNSEVFASRTDGDRHLVVTVPARYALAATRLADMLTVIGKTVGTAVTVVSTREVITRSRGLPGRWRVRLKMISEDHPAGQR